SFYLSLLLSPPNLERKVSSQEGCQGAPPLRASNEHCFIVRVLRARRATWLPSHHLLPHLFPRLCHLRLPRRFTFGRLRHHHGVEAPLQKRFGKGFRASHADFKRLPSSGMQFVEFRPKCLRIGRQYEDVPDRKLLILEPLSGLRAHLIVSSFQLILRHHIHHVV